MRMDVKKVRIVPGIRLGKMQRHKNMAVFPVFSEDPEGIYYIDLKEALEQGVIEITEIDEGGSVPELKVVNQGDVPVLILEGEEIAGGNQNRVATITVLIASHSEEVIPVNCTERGRWHHTSRTMTQSDHMMPGELRSQCCRLKVNSANRGLGFQSDQRKVWAGVRDYSDRLDCASETEAMSDVYEEHGDEFKDYREAIPCLPGQRGLLVMINGEVAGLDYVSRESVYSDLHAKVLEAYAMDAMVERHGEAKEPAVKDAHEFIEEIKDSAKKQYKSTGLGQANSYESPRMTGISLSYKDAVIHAGFFHV